MTVKRAICILFAIAALPGCSLAGLTGQAPAPRAPAAAPAALDMTPQNRASLYLDVVGGLVKQARYGAALAFLDSFAANEKDPAARYWLLRGDALLGLGRYAEADAAYTRLDATPLVAPGLDGKGRIAAGQRQWQEAESNFRKAVLLAPSNAEFLNNLAYAGMHLGHLAAAGGYLRQAHELDPGSRLIRNNLVIVLTLTGDTQGANEILKTIPDGAQRADVQAIVRGAVGESGQLREGKS